MREKILALRKQGLSYRQIQDELGCSKGTISYHLGEGQKEKTKNRQRVIRSKIKGFLSEYKQQRGCKDCGENYPYWMLEFDHLRDKEFAISEYKFHTTDLEKIKKEIEKCDVVCANCHRIRTHNRQITSGESLYDIEKFY